MLNSYTWPTVHKHQILSAIKSALIRPPNDSWKVLCFTELFCPPDCSLPVSQATPCQKYIIYQWLPGWVLGLPWKLTQAFCPPSTNFYRCQKVWNLASSFDPSSLRYYSATIKQHIRILKRTLKVQMIALDMFYHSCNFYRCKIWPHFPHRGPEGLWIPKWNHTEEI